MSYFSKIASYHSSYIAKFYNKKLAGVGAFVGSGCGLTYLSEYYYKKNITVLHMNGILLEKKHLVEYLKIFKKKRIT